jgi:cyclic pyranopterin phosphate synthase
MAEPTIDRLSRPLGSLRLSVTDRCNMRCRYCMPEEDYIWLPRASILTFEELRRLTGIFSGLGVAKFRLTGGEPLLRHDLPTLVTLLASTPGLRDLAMTTNGILLARHAEALRAAGLQRVTVSLDTLRPERMIAFARSARHEEVIEGIRAARAAGFEGLKLNTVVIRGYNDDELGDLVEFARKEQAEPRFIEYMDVGGATAWSRDQVVSRDEILERLSKRFGPPEALPGGRDNRAPADRYRLPDGTVIGIIASTTAPFCSDCDRARLTADGTLFLCLYAREGLDLREPLRTGATDDEIAKLIRSSWSAREDRGAEQRLTQLGRGALYPVESLRVDPHREMHVRGG